MFRYTQHQSKSHRVIKSKETSFSNFQLLNFGLSTKTPKEVL
ncbi:hypothetical protein BH10PAT3_BH10PAT3_3520 [soil metagenome]